MISWEPLSFTGIYRWLKPTWIVDIRNGPWTNYFMNFNLQDVCEWWNDYSGSRKAIIGYLVDPHVGFIDFIHYNIEYLSTFRVNNCMWNVTDLFSYDRVRISFSLLNSTQRKRLKVASGCVATVRSRPPAVTFIARVTFYDPFCGRPLIKTRLNHENYKQLGNTPVYNPLTQGKRL